MNDTSNFVDTGPWGVLFFEIPHGLNHFIFIKKVMFDISAEMKKDVSCKTPRHPVMTIDHPSGEFFGMRNTRNI